MAKQTKIKFPDRWEAPMITGEIPHGDMPGDVVHIGENHIRKAQLLFPELLAQLKAVLEQSFCQRAVITVCGGSGVGKSETASLISYYLQQLCIGSYTLSGDNYPRRIPCQNDAERMRVFRTSGVRGLITAGQYDAERAVVLKELQLADIDTDPAEVVNYPWLSSYQAAGRCGLKGYLGTSAEQNFAELEGIVSQFKNGEDQIWLKRMGREETELWYELKDFSEIQVLVIEWTHGNSDYYQGVDIPVLLNSTPEETREYRRLRNRDGKTDSAFTTMVLEVEQKLLESQAHKAKIIVAKSGELLSYTDYRQLMAKQS